MTEPFVYGPLGDDCIRLFTVVEDQTTPRLLLEDFHDDRLPEFDAISYSWGVEPPMAAVICNGRHLPLAAHLCEAFRILHTSKPNTYFWIDAVCVNQDDKTNRGEKNTQVQKMGRIYGGASLVHAWLGLHSDHSELVFDPSNTLAIVDTLSHLSGALTHDQLQTHGLPIEADPFWPAVGRLCRRAWFYRLWVVEEVVLAKQVEFMCGAGRLSWRAMVDLIAGVLHAGLANLVRAGLAVDYTISDGLSTLGIMDRYRRAYSNNNLNPMIVADYMRLKYVTKRVDRVYGMRSMLRDEFSKAIDVRYRYEEERFWQPYLDFASYIVPRDPSLMFLCTASSRDRPAGLPTWCPNFNSSQPELYNFGGVLGYRAGFIDEGSRQCRIEVLADPQHRLKVPGYAVDWVEEVVEHEWSWSVEVPPRLGPKGQGARILEWEQTCLSLSRKAYGMADGVPDAHWRTLIADVASDPVTAPRRSPAPEAFREGYHGIKSWWHNLRNGRQYITQGPAEMIVRFAQAVGQCQARPFFRTRGNRVGRGPTNVRVGDQVCAFQSAGPLFILRPDPTGEVATLVGDAYVHGLMDLRDMPSSQRDDLRDFVIG